MSENSALQEIIEKHRDKKNGKKWEGTCGEYIELVKDNPMISQLAPARIFNMVMSQGTKEVPMERKITDGIVEYDFFSGELFGIEEVLHQTMEFFKAGARRTETGKRVLVLVGPPAGGKSTAAEILKRGLENDPTPIYMIKGCPMFEEPLHLVPRSLRPQIEEYIGAKIEGDICPHCRHNLLETKNEQGNYLYKDADGKVLWEKVPVVQFTISARAGRGIGVFEPTDPKSQDIGELVGGEDIAVSSRLGRGHPLSFRLDGELEKASRGIMEFREIFRFDVKFLYTLFGVAQEQTIKVQGTPFPLVYADTLVLAHINTEKFDEFRRKLEEKALQSRMYTIYFPYNLRVTDEIKIYKKLIDRSEFRKIHLAPYSLWAVAAPAVMSRYFKSGKCSSLIKKMKYYDGQKVLEEEKQDPLDVRELLKEGQGPQEVTKKEGMFGIDPRIAINAINIALARKEKAGCFTAIDALQVWREIFGHHMNVSAEETKTWEMLIYGDKDSVLSEYKEVAKREVNKAFLTAFAPQAKALFDNYIKQVTAYCLKKKLPDPVTKEEKPPDEKLMRSIEEQVGISDNGKKEFRQGVMVQKGAMECFSLDTYQPLQEAIERKLLMESKGMLSLAINPEGEIKDPDARKWREDLIKSLKKKGYCESCANQLLDYVNRVLNE